MHRIATQLIDRYGVLALVGWLGLKALAITQIWHADMAGIYLAARFFAEGQFELIYPSATELVTNTPVEWKDTLAAIGYAEAPAYPYVYPPIWAAILAPLASNASPESFLSLSALFQCGLFFWSVYLAWDLAGRFMPWPRWATVSTLVVATASATSTALDLNQPQISVAFLILFAARHLRDGNQLRAGLWFALAAAIKLTPALFILMLVATRAWRAVAAMILILTVLVIADLLVCGGTLNQQFLQKSRVLADYTVSARITYNLAALLMTAFGSESDVVRTIGAGGFTFATPLWVKLVAFGALIGLSAASWFGTRHLPRARQIGSLTVLFSLVIALTGPFGWSHYFLVPTLMLPALLDRQFPPIARPAFVLALPLISTYTIFHGPTWSSQLLPVIAYFALFALFGSGQRQNPVSPDGVT